MQGATEEDDKDNDSMFDVPDRLTGKEELSELEELCPGRQWNLVSMRQILSMVYTALGNPLLELSLFLSLGED